MNQILHGEASPSDVPSTPQQAHHVLTEIDNLSRRSARDPGQPLDPEYNDEDFLFTVPADRVPPAIAEHIIDPPVDDMSVFGTPEYSFFTSRPRDEFNVPKESDEAYVAWVGIVRKLTKPNGVSYSSSVDYTVASENNAPLYHLERRVDIEKNLPERTSEAALMLHLAGGSEDEDELSIEEIQEGLATYTRILESLDDQFDEDLWEEVGRLRMADSDHQLGIDRTRTPKTLAELAAGDDLAIEYGLTDVSFAEADAVIALLRSLDLFDQS